MSDLVHFILYVADQSKSAAFYSRVLEAKPRLDVPGMTEFAVGPGVVLGLMPETGIQRLLGSADLKVATGQKISRAEVYLHVADVSACFRRAIDAGGKKLSDPAMRSWGHVVAYCLDPDAHVLAFARDGQMGK